MQFHDQLNREIQLSKTPQRIVSLVPSQTELLVDLGLEDNLVGVTKFCVHPQHISKEKEVVGGTKQIKLEKIKALKPDIVLCNKEENTKEIVDLISEYFPVHVSDIETLDDAYEMIQQYGELFSVEEKATILIENIKSEVSDFQNFIKNKPKLKVAYFIWRKPWMVVGGNTFINHLLKLNNFENVYGGEDRYPEVKLENLKQADLILLSSEPFPFKEKHKIELEAYAEKSSFHFVDGEYFSWYGSRLEAAFRYFKKWHEAEL